MTRSEVPAEFRPASPNSNLPATERQLKYLRDLAVERDIPEDACAEILKRVDEGAVTKSRASDFIQRLLDKPKAPQSLPATGFERPADPSAMPDVPAGRYAIREDEVTKFYKVDRPDEGRWAGYTFLAVQASDDLHPIKMTDTKRRILAKIAEDPKAALLLYGQEIGSCGHCGRTLTDETSRERGIGPVCARKLGYEF